MVGFSPGGEKRYTAGIEWILQQFQVYNKDIDYPVYVSSHPPPGSIHLHSGRVRPIAVLCLP